MTEEWRAVVGYESYYEVSDLGRVRSLRTGKLRRATPTDWGYLHLSLSIEGNPKHWKVHRLVAMAFIPLIDGKTHVNHKNGDKLDNRAVNLEWMTKRENEEHAGRLGRHHAATNPNRGWKLTPDNVVDIRRRFNAGERAMQIARDYPQCNPNYLWKVCVGQKRSAG